MKRWLVAALVALVVSILHLQVFTSSIGERVEPWSLDLWFNLRGIDAPPPDVVLVSMDEASYRVLNIPIDRAWPRSLHAQLLNRLADLGAKRVAMDILFLGESSDPEADKALAAAMKRLPVVIGTEAITKEMGVGGGRYAVEEVLEPHAPFRESAEKVALVKMVEEFGYIRRFHLPRSMITKDIPTLYEAAAGFAARDPSLPGERDLLWYYGPPNTTIPAIAYHQALNPDGGLPKDFFKNKIVFVGLNFFTEVGPAQKDSFRTPFDTVRTMFGVEILATATANLISHKWIHRASKFVEGLLLFIITFGLSFAVFSVRPQWAATIVGSVIVLWVLVAYFASTAGLFIPGVLLVFMVLPITLLGSTLVYYLVTYRSQQQVEKAFQYYLSPEMAKEMRSNPNALGLGGESIFGTAVFTDIAGFTEITEKMSAADVSRMLNAYFTEVMNEIFENKGTLIKFIGDAVFAIWGAPIKVSDHAKLACKSALAIHRGVERFNASKRFPPLHTRIGVNTGSMLVGNLGSERRFDYTAIGDPVNLASRVEGINKYFGTSILITDSTKRELGSGEFQTFTLGIIRVSGKKERIGLSVLLEKGYSSEVQDEWEQALKAFKQRKWNEAEVGFEKAAEKEPALRKAATLYLTEINYHREHPPGEDWEGEVEFKSK